MSFVPYKMLITGGAGFIGSHFIIDFLKNHPQTQIINLDQLTYAANLDNLNSISHLNNYIFIQGNICDKQLVSDILSTYQIDTIVNFAAESHVDRSIEDSTPFFQTNILGACNLLQCSYLYWKKQFNLNPNHCRFHQISTDEVYGSLTLDDPSFTEESPYRPNSPYAASKAAADLQVRAYFHTYRLPVTISNCSNNYGAHQHNEKLIPTIIRNCFELKPIPIYNDGSNIRDWIFVEDHCQGIDKILHQGIPGTHYNLGGNEEITNLNLAHLVCDEFDKIFPEKAPHRRLIRFVADRPGHDFRYAINNQLVFSTLDWKPQYRIRNILQSLIQSKMSCYA